MNLEDNLEDRIANAEQGELQQMHIDLQKMNKYLSSSLRTLNITIDVLLEQYNPSKLLSIRMILVL